MEEIDIRITGMMYNYSLICNRKLWFFTHKITMEDENEYVQLGKEIDETTYSRNKKHIMIDNIINIDYIEDNVICEIKKSSAQKNSSIAQIKYYLYILNKKGINIKKGILKVPKENYQEEIILTNKDMEIIEKNLVEIKKIIKLKKAPEKINNSICKKCAYYEICYI